MMRINLSPSKIEKYRQYLKEEYNGFITKNKLIDTIKGLDKWTPKAEFGSAFHAVIEHGAAKYLNNETGNYHIQDKDMPSAVICTFNEIQLADQFHKNHPHMTFETWLAPEIKIDNNIIVLRMRIDGLEGDQIHEQKTTARQLDVDFYHRSQQWKTYVMATGAPLVQYNIFTYKEPTEKRKEREVSYYPIQFHPGSIQLEQEVKGHIRGLINFCELNGLMDCIIAK